MPSGRLTCQIHFIIEIDQLKRVLRQTLLMDKSRRENDAEHSWHIAVMAALLAEHADEQVDVLRVIKTLLIHDVVEIDAGDTFAYDDQAHLDKEEREQRAADRLFGLLPEEQGRELRSLWDQFEAQSTPEARFALAMDRLQPLLHNYQTGGATWQPHGVTAGRVQARMEPIGAASAELGAYVEGLIADAVRQGFLKP